MTVFAVIVALTVLFIVLALREGPIALPGLARLAEQQVSAATGLQLSVGAARVGIDEKSGLPVLTLDAARLVDPNGETVLSVPRLSAEISTQGLTSGRIAPVAVSVDGIEAEMIRGRDGRLRLSMMEAVPGEDPAGARNEDEEAAIRDLFDRLSGGGPLPPGLEHLTSIRVSARRLVLRAEATGREITAEDALVELTRRDGGLDGRIDAPLLLSDGQRVTLRASGRRTRDSRDTQLVLAFGNLPLATLADDVPEIAFLSGIDAPVSGAISATLTGEGEITDVSASLNAGHGRLVLEDRALPIDRLAIDLAFSPQDGRLTLDDLSLFGPVLSAELSGEAVLVRDEAGLPRSIEADLSLGPGLLSLPEVLASSIAIERGHAVLAADLESGQIDIAALTLERDALVLSGEGKLSLQDDGLRGALRVTGQGVTVDDIKTFWPANAARNARRWVRQHLIEGTVPDMVAHVGLAPGNVSLALDFGFADLIASPLDGMPPIIGAAGRATVTTEELVLAMSTGTVTPEPGLDVDLSGSSLRIYDFEEKVTPADISIEAEGSLAGILAVIDRPPLGLVQRLGLPIGGVSGRAELTADLAFPLIQALLIEDIDVSVESRARDVALVLPMPDAGPMTLSSPDLTIRADTAELTLTGPINLAGSTLSVAWEERYGAAPGRSLTLSGPLSLDTLRALDVLPPSIGAGPIGLDLRLDQASGGRPRIELDADLAALSIDPPTLAWSKPAGGLGRVEISGSLGDDFTIDRARITGTGMTILGSGVVADDGAMRFDLETLQVAPFVDLAGTVEIRDDLRALDLRGALLDIALLRQAEEDAGTDEEQLPAFALNLDVARLRLTDALTVTEAEGRVDRPAGGTLTGRFTGWLNDAAPVTATLSLPPEQQGSGALTLESSDAGGFLRAAELADQANGGSLRLDAVLPDGSLDRVEGTVTMRDLRVTEGSTFAQIVRDGDLEEEIEVEGLGFDTVELPFRFRDGLIAIDNAIAAGPKLAVRLSGSVNQDSNDLDLRGVASPAYALSGFLDDVPILGRILTGRRGEGILGLTFSVSGPLEEPKISVNPLSILVPGILRDLFSAGRRGDIGEDPSATNGAPNGGGSGERSAPAANAEAVDVNPDR
ncbi:MAG: AsmA-like C-terminal domain-containing protein [Pseudomonadota bacterium]